MLDKPTVPEQITVHLGRPENSAVKNLTVNFPYYIKNVASSEIYPTWPEEALRANIYAIISFTLNRVYTEWYRSQGYNFDITNSIQFDQSFVPDRDIPEPINSIVDEIFNNYIVRRGNIEPLFATYCDGVEVQCDGLSQWGTVELANKGFVPYEILTYYYGDDIDIVENAPVSNFKETFPGKPLNLGDSGNSVERLQTQLNRVGNNYPAIPKIIDINGVYDKSTQNAVSVFQDIFLLPVTGVTDKATWYKVNYIYSSVKKLSQLGSEGVKLEDVDYQFPDVLQRGDVGANITYLQYFLEVVGAYYESVLPTITTGSFDEQTENGVISFQKTFGITPDGIVDEETWEALYSAYLGIVESVPFNNDSPNAVLYSGKPLTEGQTSESVKLMQEYLNLISETYNEIPSVTPTGYFGPITKNAVTAFQTKFGITPTGIIGATTWNEISNVYSDLKLGYQKKPAQFPGYTIK